MFGRHWFGGRWFGPRYFGDGDDAAPAIPQAPGLDYPKNVKALSVIEADVDRCGLTYGVAPCMATTEGEDATGTRKCFNTRKTCQDRANFLLETETLRYAKPTAYLPREFEALPNIEAISYDPGTISLGENLGERASLSVTFKDHPHSDTAGLDPYLADRDYDPYRQGSYWPKFRARQPFLQGRPLRWLDGRLGQSLAEMDQRHFVMEKFTLGSDGRYTLTAKDVLKLADDDRAQCPALSTGRLSGSLTTSTTSISLTPSGIGNTEYPASGWVNIGGKEIAAFTRTADALTLTRAQLGTVAVAHDAQDRVQLVYRQVSADPADILYDWFVNYAGVPAEYIDLPAWQAETAAHYRQRLTGTVAEPTGINTLASEVIEQAALAVWWEPLTQQIRLQVLKAITTDAERYTPANTVEGSFAVKEQPEKRLSQVWVFYGQINPLEDQDKEKNYRGSQLVVATDEEVDYGVAKIKKIFSRWMASGASAAALRLGNILLSQYKDPPRRFTLKLAKHAKETPTLGEGVRLQAQVLQDDTGAAADVPAQIVRLGLDEGRYTVELEEANFAAIDEGDLNNRQITISSDEFNVDLLAKHNEVYPPPVAGDEVTFIVESWVTVGSTSTTTYAMDSGSWPSVGATGLRTSGSPILTGLADTSDLDEGMGVVGTGIPDGARILSVDSGTQITLDVNATSGSGTSTALTIYTVIVNLMVRGRIQGMGGKGGRGKSAGGPSATSGEDGGSALKVRTAINLTDADGRVWSGGGGGGGAGVQDLTGHYGGGGGGGAGTQGGLGGGSDNQAGAVGNDTVGGPGGNSLASFSPWVPPYQTDIRGGEGGGPGLGGNNGGQHGTGGNGIGGSAGYSIDGISLVKTIGSAGDRRGTTIN